MSLIAQHSTIEKIIPKIYKQSESIEIHTNMRNVYLSEKW